jgi:hypothetical protein
MAVAILQQAKDHITWQAVGGGEEGELRSVKTANPDSVPARSHPQPTIPVLQDVINTVG